MGAHDVLRAIFGVEDTAKSLARNCGDNGDTVTGSAKPLITRQNPVTQGTEALSPPVSAAVTRETRRGDSEFQENQYVTGGCHPVTASPRDCGIGARALQALSADERDAFEERAAILEYDAGLSRAEAERLAAADIARLHDRTRQS